MEKDLLNALDKIHDEQTKTTVKLTKIDGRLDLVEQGMESMKELNGEKMDNIKHEVEEAKSLAEKTDGRLWKWCTGSGIAGSVAGFIGGMFAK